jgi:hypothetical protein
MTLLEQINECRAYFESVQHVDPPLMGNDGPVVLVGETLMAPRWYSYPP